MTLLLLLACADTPAPPPESHKLTDLFRPQVQLNTGAVPGGTEQIQLFLHPLTPGVCHPIPALVATMDGKPMTRLHGRVEGKNGYDRDCAVYEFTIDPTEVAGDATSLVSITDGVSTYTMEVANLLAPRAVTPSATEVTPGDTLTLAWSPPTDTPTKDGDVGLELKAADKRAVVKRKDITFGPGTLTFVVPEGLSGEVTASVFGTLGMQPAVTKCEGADHCGVSREYDVASFRLKLP